MDDNGETVWIDKNEGEDYYTDGAGNKYYMQPEEKDGKRKEKSTKAKASVEEQAEPTQADKGSNVEIIEPHTKKNTGETETVAPKKKPNGPGETVPEITTEEQTKKPIGPGETARSTEEQTTKEKEKVTKEPTVESIPATTTAPKEETVPSVPSGGPVVGNTQTVEPRPE